VVLGRRRYCVFVNWSRTSGETCLQVPRIKEAQGADETSIIDDSNHTAACGARMWSLIHTPSVSAGLSKDSSAFCFCYFVASTTQSTLKHTLSSLHFQLHNLRFLLGGVIRMR
jgi:hypothetical protein